MSEIIRQVTPEQRAVVQSIPTAFVDDYEDQYDTYRSTQQATDPTHIEVNVAPTMEEATPQIFDLKASEDARQIVENHEKYQAEQEQKELKKQNSHIENMSAEEQKAIVSLIIRRRPEIVFEALTDYHKILDTAMKDASLVEGNRWETHERKYTELLNDLTEDKKALIQHLQLFKSFSLF